MSEINNNIPNFHRNIDCEKLDKNPKSKQPINEIVDPDGIRNEYKIVPDTGVLGRSQVKPLRGGDIAKSVDETVDLTKKDPAILTGSETVFNILYEKFIKEGMEPGDAYLQAALAEEEFVEAAAAHC